jgi:hypothetical protein
MSNKPQKVERGGEVQPDRKDKGSDANIRRDKYGIPEGGSREADQPDQEAKKKPRNAGAKIGAKN